VKLKQIPWELRFSLALVLASVALHLVHYAFFHNFRHLWLWGLTSLAFLPISVLVVTMFVDRLLSLREKDLRLEKLNMLIGAFFSTVGTRLLGLFCSWDPQVQHLRGHFGTADAWQCLDLRVAQAALSGHAYGVLPRPADLAQAKELLNTRLDLLLRLLENPTLLEHESFTELLQAVFHFAEELSYRPQLEGLPESDLRHLAGDATRCYSLLLREWVTYLIYLRVKYPYLFSLAVRTNPLDPQASATVQ
jgi:hypothetical protein